MRESSPPARSDKGTRHKLRGCARYSVRVMMVTLGGIYREVYLNYGGNTLLASVAYVDTYATDFLFFPSLFVS